MKVRLLPKDNFHTDDVGTTVSHTSPDSDTKWLRAHFQINLSLEQQHQHSVQQERSFHPLLIKADDFNTHILASTIFRNYPRRIIPGLARIPIMQLRVVVWEMGIMWQDRDASGSIFVTA